MRASSGHGSLGEEVAGLLGPGRVTVERNEPLQLVKEVVEDPGLQGRAALARRSGEAADHG